MDDFWNQDEYQRFAESMNKIFPDRPVVEIEDKDAIFHTVYDLDDRYQIQGMWSLRGGRGGIAGGGKGAAIGAGVGAAGGAGVEVLTKGKQVKVPAETILNFRLDTDLRLQPASW